MICHGYRLAGLPVPPRFRYVPVEDANERLMSHYHLQPYPGKVTLMRAIDFRRTVGTVWNPTLGWDNYAAGGIEIHDVPGEHNSMLREPNVKILAETLKSVLAATTSARWTKSIAS